jgi:tetratricopeptide (TPR) repeat protein
MNTSLRANSAYFVGLLWGMHFNLQMGDTAQARAWLATLEAIDAKNQVVATFRHLIDLGDSIRLAKSLPARAAERLTVARLYQKIELFDEALDETERSLGDDPTQAPALMLRAELLLHQARPRVAAEAYRQLLGADPGNALARKRVDSLLEQRAR